MRAILAGPVSVGTGIEIGYHLGQMRQFAVLLLVASAGVAGADESSDEAPPAVTPSYDDGLVAPFSISGARPATALVLGDGGYDGARKAGVVDVAAEMHVWGPIYVRGGGSYVSSSNTLKPLAGALVRVFDTPSLAGSAGLFYKPEGLTEPEGEIEGLFALTGRAGATTITGNIVYGQDAEASESDAELRLGATVRASDHWLVGADSRLRLAINQKAGKVEPDYDLVAGPVATLVLREVAVTAEAGVSLVKVGTVTSGPILLLGMARVF
jgi:hypothetical protein